MMVLYKFTLIMILLSVVDVIVMTLAVAKTLVEANGDNSKIKDLAIKNMQELGKRYPNAGYGSHFRAWLYSKDPKPYNSFGNGSAMRNSPVAYTGRTMADVALKAGDITKVSHNHEEGMNGSIDLLTPSVVKVKVGKKYKIKFCTSDNVHLDEVTYESLSGAKSIKILEHALLISQDYTGWVTLKALKADTVIVHIKTTGNTAASVAIQITK